jgi:hypothetical protein
LSPHPKDSYLPDLSVIPEVSNENSKTELADTWA